MPCCQCIKATMHTVCELRRLLRLLRLLRVAQLLFNSPAAAAGIPSFVNRAWVALAQILYSAGFLINLLGCLWCAAFPNNCRVDSVQSASMCMAVQPQGFVVAELPANAVEAYIEDCLPSGTMWALAMAISAGSLSLGPSFCSMVQMASSTKQQRKQSFRSRAYGCDLIIAAAVT